MGSFINYILGHAFGTGYAREILGSTITASPHNYYIQLLHDFGFLGLSIFGLLYFGLSIRFFKFHKVEPANRIMLVLLSSQLIFNLAYSPNLEQGIILGLALAINRIPKDLENYNIWVEDDNFLKDEMKVTL
jgi:O-antigen ligase